jgi:hypothetical protein
MRTLIPGLPGWPRVLPSGRMFLMRGRSAEGFFTTMKAFRSLRGHQYAAALSMTISAERQQSVVTKKQAAKVYLEVMACRDGLPDRGTTFGAINLFIRRWIKYGVVRVWPGYFHRHKVSATYEEMAGGGK